MYFNPSEILQEGDDSDAIMFSQIVYEGFKRAQQEAGKINYFYNIGGDTICLSFAGSSLIPYLTPALAHLEIQPTSNPALTICLWDNASTGAKMPILAVVFLRMIAANWWQYLDTRKEIKVFNSDRIATLLHVGPNIFSLLDRQQNLAFYWLENAEQIPYWEHGSPLQTILNWWTSQRDCQYVHAGAVGTIDGGVLLAGKGGSGKSTSCLACLNSDLIYASDDYCLVTLEPNPYVYSLYNTAKLKGVEDLQRFPHLAPLICNPDCLEEEKVMIFLQQHYPGKVVSGFPIRAVLVPTVTGKLDTNLKKTSPIAGLKALAPSTLFQLAGTGQETFKFMSQLVRQVPCYTLELGTDISQIPEVISHLLKELNRK